MSSERITVSEFDDISDHLPPREAEGVARAVNAGAASVLVVEDWLVDEKDLDAIDGQRRVFAGEIERETDKAWLVSTGPVEDWIPQSQSTLFESTGEPIETPQRGLGEFAGESLRVE